MSIQFEWQEFLEEDDRWSALFVRLDEGPWTLAKNVYGTENIDIINTLLSDGKFVQEIGNNVVFPNGYNFHKSFIESYRGLSLVNTRRKLKLSYSKSMQNTIISYLKTKNILY
jgi:hypothetical protein